ncbi:DNA repair protein RecN [Kingella negevensis]|uniref:DNA repair protein RecN n=1 Tax=Kingella negevensis TaxID=1522312 RepID=A0A238TDP5_9NEIS|nr:DNA repair protein RecN [Kingella negevensis]MDK4684252.1 DNA repair protein RecN [Kingella negevensis]MDK4698140.1 DNA repair protein RecN [Kingella negevensis]MDK4707203.1 DNA repair protein RecN [Kingella negevensis]MDK4710781.1 DNA repair protein RecN [Kingella negevensis]SNB75046.1 DNA repair protein RecN [Kingella negevensis]
MLLALSLQDFVIVEKLNLNFQNGFTVLTGETGAGKSITLDALALLLGDKADYSQVRNGAKEAQLSALFDVSEMPDLQAELREQGLLDNDSTELSIRRIIDAKGKSRSFINNQAATLAQLKQIGSQLIDIHGQNAHHSLNQETAQRQLLDAFSGSLNLVEQTKADYQAWQNAKRALSDAQTQAENLAIERERLEWQFNELEQLGLETGEWETLNQSHDSLANAAELLQAASEAQELVGGDNGLQKQVFRCQRVLGKLGDIEPRFAESLAMLDSIEAELSEILHNVGDVLSDVEINPNELAAKEKRIQELMSMARKYRVEPELLPEKLDEIQAALHDLEAAADIDALQKAVAQTENAYMETAQKLSAKRHKAAAKLSVETTEHMQGLAMKGAKFHIELLPSSPAAHGLEQVQYQVAANKGSQLRPLNKVASGGELARISLSIQVVTSQYTHVPTLIFDEVDTGIGGGVAETVGRALRTLGAKHQVLAVTHLPQVAACGEHHWQVAKHSDGEQTVSEIKVLDESLRVEELARMLGGEKITETTRTHAREMLAVSA